MTHRPPLPPQPHPKTTNSGQPPCYHHGDVQQPDVRLSPPTRCSLAGLRDWVRAGGVGVRERNGDGDGSSR